MRKALAAVMMLAAVGIAMATASADPAPGGFTFDDAPIVMSEGFLSAHPDMRWRVEGLKAMDDGKLSDAYTFFRRAARYADKPSQAIVAEMLWKGDGVEQNRPLAYAWMDLAAERGQRQFTLWREQLWAQLSPEEQAHALEIGGAVYDEYGDEVAQPRQERIMRRARRQTTGSRTGHIGSLQIELVVDGRSHPPVDAGRYYNPRYWDPEQYWEWQEEVLEIMPTGRIDVLPIQPDEPPQPPEEPETP